MGSSVPSWASSLQVEASQASAQASTAIPDAIWPTTTSTLISSTAGPRSTVASSVPTSSSTASVTSVGESSTSNTSSSAKNTSSGLTGTQKGIIAGSVAGAVAVLAVIVITLLLCRRRKWRGTEKRMSSLQSGDSNPFVTVPDHIATPPQPPGSRFREMDMTTVNAAPLCVDSSALPTYEQSQISASSIVTISRGGGVRDPLRRNRSNSSLSESSLFSRDEVPTESSREETPAPIVQPLAVHPKSCREQLEAEAEAELARTQSASGSRPLHRSGTMATFSTVSSMGETLRSEGSMGNLGALNAGYPSRR